MKSKILVLGTYTNPPYHPLTGVDEILKSLLPDREFICTEDTSLLLTLADGGYDTVISYVDDWANVLPPAQVSALVAFVEQGGLLLAIHNGICIASAPDLKQLLGAKFITHPTREDITFLPLDVEEAAGCEAFSLYEEPYQFDMVDDGKTLFMNYNYRGGIFPAGWKKQVGKGQVVFLTPGHTTEEFRCPAYQKLILKFL